MRQIATVLFSTFIFLSGCAKPPEEVDLDKLSERVAMSLERLNEIPPEKAAIKLGALALAHRETLLRYADHYGEVEKNIALAFELIEVLRGDEPRSDIAKLVVVWAETRNLSLEKITKDLVQDIEFQTGVLEVRFEQITT